MNNLISASLALIGLLGVGAITSNISRPHQDYETTKTKVVQTVSTDDNYRNHRGDDYDYRSQRDEGYDEDSWMQERRKEYEAIIEEEVENGKLSQEDADEYKSDFYAMQDYCRRVRSNNGRSGIRTRGCH